MSRRLKEERQMPDSHPWLHLQLQDQEKRKIVEMYDEVDILKNEVAQLQKSLQNSYIKIKQLRADVDYYEKRVGPQMEFKF